MKNAKLRGVVVPIVTPMHSDESVSERSLREQVERMVAAGVHGIFCLGTNGECFALNNTEKLRVIEIVAEQTDGRLPVYAGTGCITTKETVALSKKAKQLGADVLSVITPYFAAASQDQLIRHYKEVAGEAGLPVMVYNIPARTGVAVTPATWHALCDVEGIVGIKDSSGNFDNMLQYIEASRGTDCVVFSGNDSLILWNLLAGGAGGIAGCANVYPKVIAGIYNDFCAGHMDSAREKQDSLRTLRDCFRFGNPNTIIKLATALRGYAVGECRKPFDGISDEGNRALERVLAHNATLGME